MTRGNYPGDNYPGAIVCGAVIRGEGGGVFLRDNCPRTYSTLSFQQTNQAKFNSIPSQITILQHPNPKPSILLSAQRNNTILPHKIRTIKPNTTNIWYIKPHAKQCQSIFLLSFRMHISYYFIWVKYASCQEAKFSTRSTKTQS